MAEFPRLRSGAITQYPMDQAVAWRTGVCRFLDGLEQRWPAAANGRRRWVVRAENLDETEARVVWRFFIEHAGRANTFTFVDPADNSVITNCRFASDQLHLFDEEPGAAVELVIEHEG